MVKATLSRLLFAIHGVIIGHQDDHIQLPIDLMTLKFASYDQSRRTLFEKSRIELCTLASVEYTKCMSVAKPSLNLPSSYMQLSNVYTFSLSSFFFPFFH